MIDRFADDQGFDTRLITRWKVTHDARGGESGHALQYVTEDARPWRRWRFDVLHGPRRTSPRVSVFVVLPPGSADARIEVDLGALAAEPEERSATWRALGAQLLDAFRPR
ncbi:MAG: hypothetical protein IPJ77_11105 [Planctomycetes bacterium]|nr:hypothetical protein [Planctomycetota bacterium]